MPFKRPPPRRKPLKRLSTTTELPTRSRSRKGQGGRLGRPRNQNNFLDEEPHVNLNRLLAEEEEENDDEEFLEGGFGHFVEDIWIPEQIQVLEAPFSGERLIIEKIVCENFKSYAGLQTIGQFHKSFTAIIGPNGNGKSNVIDAMLFVFGYKASQLRSKRLNVLIHESDIIRDLPYASVTVHFVRILDDGQKNDEKHLQFVPESKITVKRTVFRDNSTIYYLNDVKVKFEEIADFLRENGIDIVHNRFLILQGEVETISQMPPKSLNGQEPGLLEFLEKIIGTRRYIRTLAKLEARIEDLDSDREDQLRKVDLVEKDKSSIEEPVKKAKDYLRKQNCKIRAEHLYYQVKIRQMNRKLDKEIVQMNQLEAEYIDINKKIGELELVQGVHRLEFEKASEKWAKLQGEFSAKSEIMTKYREIFEKYKSNLRHLNDQRKKAHEEIGNIEKELENMEDLPRRNEQGIQRLIKREEELQIIISQEEAKIKEPLEELRFTIDQIKCDLEGLKKILSLKKTEYAEINKRFDFAQKDLKSYKESFERENIELEKRLKDLEDTRKELAGMEKKEGNSSHDERPVKEAIQKKQLEKIELNQKLKICWEELGLVQAKFADSRESVEGLKSHDGVYKLFLGQNKVHGVFGRFKDLAKIDEKYNVAATVSTSFLEYWIVDNDITATNCIQLLKQNKLPFQNFICLNKCHDRSMNDPFNCPSDSQRIFDLLSISRSELRPVFYKGFRNTLVCDNIDIATRVAFYSSTTTTAV